jgi:hypothetical protein
MISGPFQGPICNHLKNIFTKDFGAKKYRLLLQNIDRDIGFHEKVIFSRRKFVKIT